MYFIYVAINSFICSFIVFHFICIFFYFSPFYFLFVYLLIDSFTCLLLIH